MTDYTITLLSSSSSVVNAVTVSNISPRCLRPWAEHLHSCINSARRYCLPLPRSIGFDMSASGPNSDLTPTSRQNSTPRTRLACERCRRSKAKCDIISNIAPPICTRCQISRDECIFRTAQIPTLVRRRGKGRLIRLENEVSALSALLARAGHRLPAKPEDQTSELTTRHILPKLDEQSRAGDSTHEQSSHVSIL